MRTSFITTNSLVLLVPVPSFNNMHTRESRVCDPCFRHPKSYAGLCPTLAVVSRVDGKMNKQNEGITLDLTLIGPPHPPHSPHPPAAMNRLRWQMITRQNDADAEAEMLKQRRALIDLVGEVLRRHQT